MGRWRRMMVGAVVFGTVWGAGIALAQDASRELLAADRLACAFLSGVTANFSPRGRVAIKPPLDPNTPGLTIDIVDRDKSRAVLEEDERETPGVLLASPMGLTVMARDPGGEMTLVTVFAQYSDVSDNFLMVTSKHAGGTEPRISQRYGLCRTAPAKGAQPAPAPPPAPAPHK